MLKFDKEKIKKVVSRDWPIILLYVAIGLAALMICILMPSFVLGLTIGAMVHANKNKILDLINGIGS